MATIHVDIVSAEGEIFSGEAAMVFAPAAMGDIGIAPRHAPLLTTLRPGEVRVRNTAVGLNFIDTYHRSGLYPLPLPLMITRKSATSRDFSMSASTSSARKPRVAGFTLM